MQRRTGTLRQQPLYLEQTTEELAHYKLAGVSVSDYGKGFLADGFPGVEEPRLRTCLVVCTLMLF